MTDYFSRNENHSNLSQQIWVYFNAYEIKHDECSWYLL